MEYTLSEEERNQYRITSNNSRIAKKNAMNGRGPKPVHSINQPKLDPEILMSELPNNGLLGLSLFSGCGGLDLGFEKAGFQHVSSYDIIPICGETISENRPNWNVKSGIDNGDVKKIDWSIYKNKVDVIHGGPPCQPFSISGQQKGKNDERNMWPEFIRAVLTIEPSAFVAENVPGILAKKFSEFVEQEIVSPLQKYKILMFKLNASDFGVPQNRKRVFFVGFKNKSDAEKFVIPSPTHTVNFELSDGQKNLSNLPKTMGVREALGLSDLGFDSLAPTIRSAFTGKRSTTSILNGSSGQKLWSKLEIWPNGVGADRKSARLYVPDNKHFRLSVQDCAVLQGFPKSWKIEGAVYQTLGQLGNSVAPPVSYAVAKSLSSALMV